MAGTQSATIGGGGDAVRRQGAKRMRLCYQCGREWPDEGRPGYHATCAGCHAYVYVCLNCRFYDRAAPSECQLTTTEPVRRKDHPNFCEEFRFAERPAGAPPQASAAKSQAARDRFERLFKKP